MSYNTPIFDEMNWNDTNIYFYFFVSWHKILNERVIKSQRYDGKFHYWTLITHRQLCLH